MLSITAFFALGVLVATVSGLTRAGAARRHSLRVAALASFVGLAVLSCGRETTAPEGGAVRMARGLSFMASFPSVLSQLGASNLVAFTKVRVVLRHPDGTVAIDTTVDFSSTGADQLTLSLNVALPARTTSSGETMALVLSYTNAAGEVVFTGGPTSIQVVPSHPGDPAPPPVQVPLRYSGTGANAASVRIAPRALSVTAGDNFTLTAAALDGTGATLPNTPIVWTSLDPAVATIAASGAGAGTTLAARGPARITAQLLTGPVDTVTITVLPKLASLVSVSGNGQSGPGDAVLVSPVVVRANATDGQPMAGVTVTFAPSAGGTVGAATVSTDAAGLAQTTWRLAPAIGAQTLSATAVGVATAVTFNATSTSGPAAKLVVTTQPINGTAGAVLAPVVVTAQDALGNTSSAYTGTVTMALGANPGGGALSGTTTAVAVAGVATFPALRIRQAAAGYTLVASATSLASATTNPFAVSAAPAATLALVSGGGQGALVGGTLADPIVVMVSDSVGNPVAGKTVTFSVATDGSASPVSAVTASNGMASTRWTLGATIGFQLLNVAASGLTPSLLAVGASASPRAQLQFVQQPSTTTAGIVMSPGVSVRGVTATGATDTLFTGTVTLALASNPTGATLAGTVTVAAYRGVATFSTLRLRKAGVGYSLSASASGWSPASSASFSVTAAPPVTVAVSSGNAQTGPTSAALATPLVVLVSDSLGNPVSGATVTWGTTGGSLTPASSTTNASGLASSVWTLGPAGGAQGATASVSPLSPASFSATAVAPPAAYSKTWTGATSTDWSVATNWNPAGAPSATDSILIPLVSNQPVLTAPITIGKLTVASGATLDLSTFQLNGAGAINSQGLITGAGGIMGSAGISFAGNFGITGIYLLAPASLTGATSFSGNLTQSSSLLAVNGNTLTIAGNATLNLLMNNAADSVNVGGTFTVNTGNITPNLTAGTIVVGGNFVQASMYQTFPARGTHKVVMKGSSVQHIQFYFSTNRFSHFNDLVIDNPAGVVADSVNYDNGGGYMFGGMTEVARHLTILNGTLSGASGSYLVIGGTLTDAAGGRVTMPKVYFDSSTTPVSSSTPVLTVTKVYLEGLYFGANLGGKRASLGGNLTINGNLYIEGGDTLRLNGHTLTVNGALTQPSGSNAALEMTNSADVLTVSGDITLYGYPTAGTFTAGTIYAGKALIANSLQASGSHKLVMNGSGTFYLAIGSGDSTAAYTSRLHDLEIANTAADTISLSNSGLYVNGTFTKTTSAATTLKWSGPAVEKLIVAAVNVTQPITFDRVQFWLVGGGPVTAFNNASFVNSWYYPAEDVSVGGTQQYHVIVQRGGAGSHTFDGLSFSNVTPAPTPPNPRGNPWGYVKVQGPSGLNVTLTNASPTAAGGGTAKSLASGGAALSWTP